MEAEDSVVAKLKSLFRQHGYEGASLSRITEATGLVKASLYHRFPQGKEQMASCVLEDVMREFVTYVLAPISEPGDLHKRVQETGRRIAAFYGDGKLPCLLDTLTLNCDNSATRAHAAKAMDGWIGAFEAAALEGGRKKRRAREVAEDAVAAIEGALIVARVSGNRAAFHRVIDSLPSRLIKG